ncbi:NAD(P)-binding protein [Aspergillus stella-maris]|uniref:NAD(P)-binding protein n=1 Tax=Aspergillus stella-maris TaxID=1810926 RepID=UPI003CCD233C
MPKATQKVAIVTGAASGMGAALAAHLVQNNYLVALADINTTTGQALASSLGSNATFYEMDVTSYESQVSIFSAVWEKYGRIDAFLAHAGYSDRSSIYLLRERGKDVQEAPPRPELKSLEACYSGFLYGVQLAVHFMRGNENESGKGGGCIVATSSIASIHPHATFPEYCGAKAAINHFVRAAAPVFKIKDNITLNAILPGIVATGAVPQASIDATKAEHLTPIQTIVDAYMMCLNDGNINGELIECSTDKIIFLPRPEFANGEATKRACTV